jgi:hypothetical protein
VAADKDPATSSFVAGQKFTAMMGAFFAKIGGGPPPPHSSPPAKFTGNADIHAYVPSLPSRLPACLPAFVPLFLPVFLYSYLPSFLDVLPSFLL